jgi:hypothetical protein
MTSETIRLDGAWCAPVVPISDLVASYFYDRPRGLCADNLARRSGH